LKSFLNIKRLFVVVLFLSCQIEAVDGGADLATDSLSIQGALTLALRAHPLIDSARDQFDAAKSDLSLSRWILIKRLLRRVCHCGWVDG
jgi:hypothetical protein